MKSLHEIKGKKISGLEQLKWHSKEGEVIKYTNQIRQEIVLVVKKKEK